MENCIICNSSNIKIENFRAIEVSDLKNLSAEKVFERLTNLL